MQVAHACVTCMILIYTFWVPRLPRLPPTFLADGADGAPEINILQSVHNISNETYRNDETYGKHHLRLQRSLATMLASFVATLTRLVTELARLVRKLRRLVSLATKLAARRRMPNHIKTVNARIRNEKKI